MRFAYTLAFYDGISRYAVNGIKLSNIPAGWLSKSLSVTFYDSGDKLRLSLFPEAELGEWFLEERLPTRELDQADYEVCHSIWHGEA